MTTPATESTTAESPGIHEPQVNVRTAEAPAADAGRTPAETEAPAEDAATGRSPTGTEAPANPAADEAALSAEEVAAKAGSAAGAVIAERYPTAIDSALYEMRGGLTQMRDQLVGLATYTKAASPEKLPVTTQDEYTRCMRIINKRRRRIRAELNDIYDAEYLAFNAEGVTTKRQVHAAGVAHARASSLLAKIDVSDAGTFQLNDRSIVSLNEFLSGASAATTAAEDARRRTMDELSRRIPTRRETDPADRDTTRTDRDTTRRGRDTTRRDAPASASFGERRLPTFMKIGNWLCGFVKSIFRNRTPSTPAEAEAPVGSSAPAERRASESPTERRAPVGGRPAAAPAARTARPAAPTGARPAAGHEAPTI